MGRATSKGLIMRGAASLVVLALLAITLQAVVFSGASLTDADTTSGSFTAGSVSHQNPAAGGFALSAAPLIAGGSKSQDLTITGGPDVPATYILANLGVTDEPAAAAFSTVLRLRIQPLPAGADLYNNIAANFVSADLGVIAPGVSRTYRFTLTYPAASANRSLMGAAMTMQLEFVGVSL
jgi:hypothetical protein